MGVGILVNGSRTGLVGRRHEKPVEHSKLYLYMRLFLFFLLIFKCCATPKQWHILQYDEGDHFVRKWILECSSARFHDFAVRDLAGFHMSQDLTFVLNATREECAQVGVRWCLGWRSVVWSSQPSPGRQWSGSSRWWCGRKRSSCAAWYLTWVGD